MDKVLPDKAQVLCVDDDTYILSSMKRALSRYFDIDTAENGVQALDKITQNPDYKVIVSDYLMPEMDGIDLLKQVNALKPDVMQIMLTGHAELGMAIQTVNETDIFRFLAKPCDTAVLRKSIEDAIDYYDLIASQQSLTAELANANRQLSRQKEELEQEKQLASTILNNINKHHSTHITGLNWQIDPVDQVGGDLVFSYIHPSGTLYAMLGDITGHGLPAALAALSTANAFERLSLQNLSVAEIAQGINRQLKKILPTGIFCAAILLRYNVYSKQISLWHGGLPDAFLINRKKKSVTRLHSANLPLGVVSGDFASSVINTFSSESFDTLFMCSDGATEQINANQEMFGEERLQQALLELPGNTPLIAGLLEKIHAFRGACPQSDDLAMVNLDFAALAQVLLNQKSI